MKRLRLSRWHGQLLQSRPGACISRASFADSSTRLPQRRCLSSAAAEHDPFAPDGAADAAEQETQQSQQDRGQGQGQNQNPPSLPSPPPSKVTQSAALAALHARLSLSQQIPLKTLARTMVTASADSNPNFNNANLAYLGSSIINYHVLEHLVCRWPRLPMAILYEMLRAFAGAESLHRVARRWGVLAAHTPGEEVDPAYLQWREDRQQPMPTRWGYMRSDEAYFRRGLSSRVVMDDDFGDAVPSQAKPGQPEMAQDNAFASCVQAVVGAIHAHCGSKAAKSFVSSHILSRHVDPSKLFVFKNANQELAKLCAREGFEAPVARLESETGRLSIAPVFVIGIYSGSNKLGEGAGSSLNMARMKASMAALKSWYLYSPTKKPPVPSDMIEEDAKPWTPPHIDPGEIV